MPYKILTTAALLIALTPAGATTVNVFNSKNSFLQAVGSNLQLENWGSYTPETVLENKTIRGVTYDSTSSDALVVGSPHGASWIIGYSRGAGRYASFSYETITFSFNEPVSAFGIALSQGNSSGSNSYNGSSEWQINIDSGLSIYTSTARYSKSDFTGEAYFGLLNLSPATSFAITRLSSDANIVWDIREIAWSYASAVPEPSGAILGAAGLALLVLVRSRTYRRAELAFQEPPKPHAV